MRVEHINAFIEATVETFQSMCHMKFGRAGAARKVCGQIVDVDELVSICGLSGDVKGAVMLSASVKTSLKIVSAFMMEELKDVNCDLMDGWGELANIIAGAAEAKIAEYKIQLALPSVVLGKHAKFYAKAGNPFIISPMVIENVGMFSLGISMEIPEKKK
jgi:chemotaxis protein CheX